MGYLLKSSGVEPPLKSRRAIVVDPDDAVANDLELPLWFCEFPRGALASRSRNILVLDFGGFLSRITGQVVDMPGNAFSCHLGVFA